MKSHYLFSAAEYHNAIPRAMEAANGLDRNRCFKAQGATVMSSFPNRPFAAFVLTVVALSCSAAPARDPLDPKGEIHVPIGIVNTLDSLKTFVEAEGNFSPGFATYGIYFWIYDPGTRKLTAPTMDGVACDRGLSGTGYLIPWSQWSAEKVTVRTEVCQIERKCPTGAVQVVGARAHVTNTSQAATSVTLFVALRPLGAAGGVVKELTVGKSGDALLVDGHSSLVAETTPDAVGVSGEDNVGETASKGRTPANTVAKSASGDCSGAMRFDLRIDPGQTKTVGFLCPVFAGRRAVGHDWDGTSEWAQLDLAEPNPPKGGVLQPDPGVEYYREIKVNEVFDQAHRYWEDLVRRAAIRVPDGRWAECFATTIGHAAMAMNEGAPDVAVVNYNVFNRDGVYVANILQKSGNFGLAAEAIDYFLAHPFNGRTRVEADNPGQILWAMGEHWRFTRDKEWLERVYPSAAKIAAMIRYYRTTPEPHYVKATSLNFGDALEPDTEDARPAYRRQVLRPGSCDGHHPEYTEAFDIAGLRAAAMLAKVAGRDDDAATWGKLVDRLIENYDEEFGGRLPKGYGNYSVLWPCRLYPFAEGKAREQFKKNGATSPGGWRYFALAKAHQGLLTGNREAGYRTIANHLDHPQMHGWYAFDEGGRSGAGGWRFARTTWNSGVAMPHGWAVAEMWLLLRDCLVYEDEDRLHLLPGVPPDWFTGNQAMAVESLPTYFGICSFAYVPDRNHATLTFTGDASPPGGFVLALPPSLNAEVTADGTPLPRTANGCCLLPPSARRVRVEGNRERN